MNPLQLKQAPVNLGRLQYLLTTLQVKLLLLLHLFRHLLWKLCIRLLVLLLFKLWSPQPYYMKKVLRLALSKLLIVLCKVKKPLET